MDPKFINSQYNWLDQECQRLAKHIAEVTERLHKLQEIKQTFITNVTEQLRMKQVVEQPPVLSTKPARRPRLYYKNRIIKYLETLGTRTATFDMIYHAVWSSLSVVDKAAIPSALFRTNIEARLWDKDGVFSRAKAGNGTVLFSYR